MLLHDYRGPFEPDFHLTRLSRRALATLGREWLLHGHLQDRIGMPLVLAGHSREEMEQIAINEWMGASPVYTRRMQAALRFAGDDVATIFKGIQLDIGAPHQFMDFRYRVTDRDHGEFWLAHCGALMDVEPMGREFVHGMCHTIEDPTFDATAVATNPRAQVRPVHRPPREPADRQPHCHWTVRIDADNPAVRPHANVAVIERSNAASVPVEVPAADAEPGGWPDYSGDFDPEFQLEDLSHAALVVALQEIAMESHLLFRSYLLSVSQAFGVSDARAVAPKVCRGLAGITAQRLRAAMTIEGPPGAALAKVLQLHPMWWPRTYVDAAVELLDDDRVRFAIRPCPALGETDELTWLAHLEGEGATALDAIAWAVDPRARWRRVEPGRGEHLAYEAVVEHDAVAAPEVDEIALAKISTGATFVMSPRRAVRG